MALNNDNNQRDALKRAMRLAEMRVEDVEDMQTCVDDLVRTAGLDEESAKIVASAYRASVLPEVLREAGLDPNSFEMDTMEMKSTKPFADENNAEPAMADEDADMNSNYDEMSDDDSGMEDDSEANDVATIEVEVPADKADEFQQALEEAMTKVFGDSAVAEEQDEEEPSSTDEDNKNESMGMDTMQSMANRKVKDMSRSARAEREAILASLAGNTRTASNFEYAADAQYSNEGNYDKMTMSNSEGNSLRDQNTTFNKQEVPTNNPELLGLKNEIKGKKLEGTPEDASMYEATFDLFSGTPTQGMDPDFGNFEVPTQTEMTSRSNIVLASVNDQDAAEEFLFNELTANGVDENTISNMTFAEGLALYRQINASKVETLAKVAALELDLSGRDQLAITAEEDCDCGEPGCEKCSSKMTDQASWAKMEEAYSKEAEVFRSRLKTAYGVSTKLCLAGLISPEEVEANVDLWLNDGLTVKAMLASGAQMLRMSQTAEQRVVSAHAESNVRTAGVASIPGFSGTTSNVSSDLQQALKSIFSKPEFEG
ncbi:MAG: hypothetical protein RLZ10_64 [Bacteroidota bacterium]|jgi:hypothetical protein